MTCIVNLLSVSKVTMGFFVKYVDLLTFAGAVEINFVMYA